MGMCSHEAMISVRAEKGDLFLLIRLLDGGLMFWAIIRALYIA
jgi:hypothetical protein